MRASPLLLLVSACSAAPKAAPTSTPASMPASAPAATTMSAPQAGFAFWSEPASTRCGRDLAAAEAARQLAISAKGTHAALEAVNELTQRLSNLIGQMELVSNVNPNPETREAAEKCYGEAQAFLSKLSLDPEVYRALADVPVEGEAGRALERQLLAFRLAGVDRDAATRAKLEALKKAMVETGQQFGRNIREGTRTVKAKPKQLAGLPRDFIEAHPPGEDGMVTLTTDYPDYFPVLTYAKDESLRKALTVAFLTRAYPDNGPVLSKLLELRHTYATTLGYASWADYNAQDKMAGSAANIRTFTDQVTKLARPRMEADLAVLLAAKKKASPRAKAIETWDRFYFVEKVRREKYAVDASATRAYFSYSKVLDGILTLFGELFDVRFVKEEGAENWHGTVAKFRMEREGEVLGVFYLDMHPREGKYKHAAMFPLITGLVGGPVPEAALVCNFPNPREGSGLMEHGQVVTFFHEFGHLVHHLLARSSKWTNLSGINVEWDFVEAPSQLLEEWAWSAEVLGRFATNAEGEPIPPELVARMRTASEFGKGIHVMRQVFYQSMSFELHAGAPPADLVAATRDLQSRFSPYPYQDGTAVYASFGHLDGYSSMYYTYQWSLARAKDVFTRFKQEGLLNKSVAGAYRDAVLQPGGTRPAAELLESFLGRPSNLDAYETWLSE